MSRHCLTIAKRSRTRQSGPGNERGGAEVEGNTLSGRPAPRTWRGMGGLNQLLPPWTVTRVSAGITDIYLCS